MAKKSTPKKKVSKKKTLAAGRLLRTAPAIPASVSINVPGAEQEALVRAVGGVTEGTIGATGTATTPTGYRFASVWAKIFPAATSADDIPAAPPMDGTATQGNPPIADRRWEFRLNDPANGIPSTEIPGVQVDPNATVHNLLVVWAKFMSIEIAPVLVAADIFGRAMVTFYAVKSDRTDLDA